MPQIILKKADPTDFLKVKFVEGQDRIKREYSAYLSDESKSVAKLLNWIFFPINEAELAAVMKELSARAIPFTIAAARTGLVGGCVANGGALISLESFDSVLGLQYDELSKEWRVKLQAAVSLKTLQNALQTKRFPDLENSTDDTQKRELQKFKAEPQFYFYPPDPTEMSASIGGTVATNASGARTYRYGPTRAWIRFIRVFLVSGSYLDIPRGKYFASRNGEFFLLDSSGKEISFRIPRYSLPNTKNAAGFFAHPGMDLIDLFIGSEGVLGVITQVEVALLPQLPKLSMVQFLFSEEQAIKLTIALRLAAELKLDFLEFFSANALKLLQIKQNLDFSLTGVPKIPENAGAALFFEISIENEEDASLFSVLRSILLSCGADPTLSWVAYEPRELERLKAFRHSLPETVNGIIAERKKDNPGLHKLGTDLSVPDAFLGEMWRIYQSTLNASDLEWLAFGHVGNNHLHINTLPRNEEEMERALQLYAQFAQKAVEFGGSVSAEHGIGKIKKKFFRLMFAPEEINQMHQIKLALDPLELLNRGNLFESEESA